MQVAEFIAGCQQLSEARLSAVVSETFTAGVETMSRCYAMPLGPAAESAALDYGQSRDLNRRSQWHELLQHLTDLAYLTPGDFAAWHLVDGDGPAAWLWHKVSAAVAAFLIEDDYREFALLPDYPSAPDERLGWLDRYLSVIVHRLATYTSFDGDLLARPDYVVGSHSVYGRSLAFRMRVYFHDYYGGTRTERRKQYFDTDHLPLLYSLDNSLGGRYRDLLPTRDATRLHVALQELLLASQLLFDVYREANRFTPTAAKPYYLRYDLNDAAPRREMSRREQRQRRRTDRKISREEELIDTGVNRLGVRLLQIGLWRAGFYTGVLDGAFGPRSHAAVRLMLRQERTLYDDRQSGVKQARPVLSRAQLRRVVVRSSDTVGGSYVIDLRLVGRLLDAYAPPPESVARSEEDELWQRLENTGEARRLDETLVEREREFAPLYATLRQQPQRRVYYGLRGLIRGAFRAVGRIVRWIAGAVRTVLGAVFDFVKAVVKRVQEGAGLFFTGVAGFVHYLLGRPFVSLGNAVEGRRPVMVTHYRVDFDVVSIVDRSASGADLQSHRKLLRHTLEGITYLTEVTVSVINLVSRLQPPLSWLRLGILIGRWVHDRLSPGAAGEVAV